MIWNAARVALCVIPLTGCAAKTGNTELRRRAAAVQLLRTTPEAPYRLLREVKGVSCKRQGEIGWGSEASFEDAESDLRFEAAEIGADA